VKKKKKLVGHWNCMSFFIEHFFKGKCYFDTHFSLTSV